MATIIDGTTGIDKITDGSIVAADIGAGEVTQAKLASGVAGTGPAFFAYPNTSTSIANSSSTKLTFDAEIFDTASCFDITTNYRFTPTVAGYYQISGALTLIVSSGISHVEVFKNGSIYCVGSQTANNSAGVISSLSTLIYLNGTTDYIELYGFQNSGGVVNNFGVGVGIYNYFSGVLVRAA